MKCSGIGTAGMGFGGLFYQTIVTCAKGQIGGEMTDFVIILNTEEAVRAFSRGGLLLLFCANCIIQATLLWVEI